MPVVLIPFFIFFLCCLVQFYFLRRIRRSLVYRHPAVWLDFSGGMVRDNPMVNQAVAGNTALGRVGGPQDVGPVIAALLSDDFGWVDGQRIEVSGGVHL